MMESYRIVDEPRPSPVSRLACAPFFITLATMLGGAWLGYSWFILNSFAIGSFSKRKELSLIAIGIAGSFAIAYSVVHLAEVGVISVSFAKYLMLSVVVWKLAITYRVELWQNPSFELHSHFGGPTMNGFAIVAIGAFARASVLGALDHWLARVVLG